MIDDDKLKQENSYNGHNMTGKAKKRGNKNPVQYPQTSFKNSLLPSSGQAGAS
jgi:hypothetical protein